VTENWVFEGTESPLTNHTSVDLEMVAQIYDNLAQEYTGIYTMFLTSNSKDLEKKLKNLAQLVALCYELKVSVEVYLRAQFEGLGWLLKRQKLSRPPMVQILSESGKVRLATYLERLEKSYVKPEDRRRALRARQGVDRKGLYVTSAIKFYERLQRVQKKVELTKEVAIRELEMGARTGYFSAYYVAFSPLVDSSESLYLQTMKAVIMKKLNEDQQTVLRKARGLLGIENEVVGKYV
jgi:hypothetical protein